MYSWQDLAATALLLTAAIVAGYLKLIDQKVVVAVFTAVLGYYAARTALAKRDAKAAKKEREDGRSPAEDGAPELSDGIQESGKIVVKPQHSGRTVKVSEDGSVTICPDSQPQPGRDPEPFSETDGDRTPQEVPKASTGTDDEEPGD